MGSAAQHRPSQTAKGAAICRAMAKFDQNFGGRGGDDMAVLFLNPWVGKLMRFGFFRNFIKRRFLTPGVYEYVMARTQHVDRFFTKALEENWPQIVIIGAGYDSRALRFSSLVKQSKIVEVDAQATQSHKRACIERARLKKDTQTKYVCMDINQDRIEPLLGEAGYDNALQTLFILEGLTMYLPETSINTLLNFIRENTGQGTTMVFDYFFKSVVDGESLAYGAREQFEAVRKVGEPFQFGLEPEHMSAFLENLSFKILSHYMPEEFEEVYLVDDQHQRCGMMYRCAGNVVATTA